MLAVGAVGELRLTAADAAAADLLGESVAIDGDYLVVGSPGDDDGFDGAGAAYVYRIDGSTWLQQDKLLADDPGEADGFGGAVAISGETIVVGAAGHDEAGLVDAGAAYVFVFDGQSWSIQDKLLPDDGAGGDAFGTSVTIEGDVAAVGAAGAAADVGAAYVFGRIGGVWSQQDKLLAADGETGDGFGTAIDVSGEGIVVGAPGGDAAGAAYVFQRDESDWAFLSKLPASGDAFGGAVAISGTTAIVGAAANNAGSAYVFVEQVGVWDLQAALLAPDASDGDLFGSAVDVVGDLVLVGAPHNKDVVDGAGAAYLFDRSGSLWNLRAKLAADDAATDDRFGAALALDTQRLVIGASGSDGVGEDGAGENDAGAAYAYALNRFDAPLFLSRERVDDIEASSLNEASGMVASRQSPGVLWAHNDSGGQRRVFAMNSRGEHLGVFSLGDVTHRDWEDIAIGPGPIPGVQYLYVGDFGNNFAHTGNPHPSIRIYRAVEPVVDPNGGDQSASLGVVDTFTLTYPDEAWDNETLLVDPWTGDLVLVTKRAEFNHVYRLAAPGPGDLTAELEYVGNMIWGDQPPGDGTNSGIVGGDVSPTGREIILKNYHEIGLFHRPVGTSLAEALVGVVPELVPYEEAPKGEGLSFDAEGAGYFTLGERENRPDAPLDYYPRDLSSSIATVAQFQQGVFPTPEYDGAEDALLRQSAAGTNFGSVTLLAVIADDGPAGDQVSAVLRWSDLAAVPANSPIQAVSLTFNVTDATSGSGFQLFELRRDWLENDVSFNEPWDVPGAAGMDDRGTTVLGTVRPTSTGRFTMTLNQAGVDVVQSWILNPATNHGFLLVGSDNGDALSLASSEAADPWLRPKLLIGFLQPDDVSPTVALISPVDNSPEDRDPADDRLLINPTPRFEFQLTDREVDDASVTSAALVVTRDGQPLADGVDYVFNYDTAADRIAVSSILPKFDIGEYRITLSPAGGTILDAAGNEMPPRQFVVVLDDRFPTPLEEVSPAGSLIYRGASGGLIVAAGESQAFSIELDAAQTLAVVLSPDASLRPTVRVEGPAGELIGVPVEAASAGDRVVLQAMPIDAAGKYTITVGETAGTFGAFDIELIPGALLEEEELLGSPNDELASAQTIDAGFIDLDPIGGRQRAVVLGTANAALPDTVIESGFDSDTGGFVYVDDPFGTDNSRSSGSYAPSEGFQGGGLEVFLDRGRTSSGTRGPASGGWTRNFVLDADSTVELSLRYRMLLKNGFENSEFGEVIVEIDGTRLGQDANGSLIHRAGNGNGGSVDDSGWLLAELVVPLSAGNHTLTFGAYNNRSSTNNETVEAWFDDVVIRAQGSGGQPKSDFYQFSLDQDEVAWLVLATFQNGAGEVPLALLDAAGEVLARGAADDDGSTHSIDSFVAPATGTYFVHVSSTQSFPYSLLVTRDAAFNIEPSDDFAAAQDISLVGAALGAVGAGDPGGDFYAIAVREGDTLVIATTTPADGPFQPENNLDPAIELFDPSGNLVASNDNGAADGRNARLDHTAGESGLYRVRVISAADTRGDYVLAIDGATGALAPLRVTSSDPPAGAHLQEAPSQIVVDFSFTILRPDAVDPAVLTVGGVAATGVTVLDGDTLRFDLPALGEATHEVVIDAGAVIDVRGQPIVAYHAELTIDFSGPRILSSSIGEGSVLPVGSLSLDLTFDEQLRALGLQSLGAVLAGSVSGRSYAADRVQIASDLATTTLTLEFDDLPEDLYTLRLPSGDGAVEDLAGNDLDGEPGAFPTGDGQPGGDFLLNISLDADALPLRPFRRLLPLGSLAFASTDNFGVVNTAADLDEFTFFVETGEVVMATVTPTNPATILTVELVGEAGGTIPAPGAGQPVVLPATRATTSLIKTLRIGGDTAGAGYTLNVYRNVVVEPEGAGSGSPLSIDPSSIDVGISRLAVLGTSNALETETVFTTTGSTWKYLDDNTDQGTAWRELDFDDTGWTKMGPSILGFGSLDGGGNNLPIATPGIRSGIPTVYFRRDFDVPDPLTYVSLSLQLLRDDGAAVYLNGERIALSNLADGASFITLAGNSTDSETTYFPFNVDPAKLRAGKNVLAVEVHQATLGSSDLGMEVILIGAQRLIDSYTLDLTGLIGRSIDVVLAGQVGADYSGELLELLDIDGTTVLETATADPLGAPADNYDLAILDFTVPHDGVFTLQLASLVPAGQYGIVVTTGAVFESEPNNNPGDPRRALETGDATLGFLSDAELDAFDVVLDAGQTLVVAARPVLGAAPGTPENTLDPRLRILDSNLIERATDDNSLDGRGALLDFRADQAGTYLILVQSVAGQGEYVLELLDVPPVQVVGRHVFYNNSRFDGSDLAINADDDLAIAPDKQPLLGNEPAEFANYTTFVSGINGIMVDVRNLPDANDINADDVDARQFVFRVGNTNAPDAWPLAPPPNRVTVRQGAGINGSDRIVITWPDGAIVNTWLQVTLLATIDTGLADPDVFYVGNAVGDTGLGNPPDELLVDEADRAATRANPRNFTSPAQIDFPFDFNRDGLVDGVDRAIVRANLTGDAGGLILLNQPGGGPSPPAGFQAAVAAEGPAVAADLPPVVDFPRPDQQHNRARRAAVRRVFERLGSQPPFSRYRAVGRGRLLSSASRHERDASVGRRRLAAAADLALEALT